LKYQGSTDASFNDLASFINVINNTPSNTFRIRHPPEL
jgi:hypothetical protein